MGLSTVELNLASVLEGYRFHKEVPIDVPPLLRGVGRVILASVNSKKLAATGKWIESFGIIRGEEALPVVGIKVSGDEPDWHDAMRVAVDKALGAVSQLNGKPGPEALILALDTVYFHNGQARLNLSRQQELSGPQIQAAIDRKVADHAYDGAEARWDSALAASRPGLLATTGESIVARFRKIPEDLIRKYYEENTAECININAGLPLIDNPVFEPYIDALGVFPLVNMVDRQSGRLKEWHFGYNPDMVEKDDPLFPQLLQGARIAVVGGIPSPYTLSKIVQLSPRTRPSGLLIV